MHNPKLIIFAPAPHPRVVFRSVAEALQASPFFIEEEGVGIWLSTDDERLLAKGKLVKSARNAIHIPSLEKNGRQIQAEVIADFCRQAEMLGLNKISRATGYWTLSETGVLQAERVIIAYTEKRVSVEKLRRLASEIIRVANQEAVAIEISGQIEHWREK